MEDEKDYFMGYATIKEDITKLKEEIYGDLSKYKVKIGNNENTIGCENNLKQKLDNYKDIIEKLDEAYNSDDIPSNIPQNTLIKRQDEIKKFLNSYDEMKKDFGQLYDKKYSSKIQITEDYRNKEELKGLSTGDLLLLKEKKLKEQDETIDQITSDAKKGTQMAKNLQHEFKEQTKKITEINEDMDMLDTRMNKLTKRFNKYAAKSSTCCLCIVFWCDVAVFVLLLVLFNCIQDDGKFKC